MLSDALAALAGETPLGQRHEHVVGVGDVDGVGEEPAPALDRRARSRRST